jgi:rare lipoprotein A (peptidoglycan hydrolase)
MENLYIDRGWPRLLAATVMLMLAVGPAKLAAGKSKRDSGGRAFVQTGEATWYGKQFHGQRTASGETFNTYDLTAAHRTLPFGTMVKVTNLENGKSVIVRINDRGPFVRGRIIDLSYAAAREIGLHKSGAARVRLEALDENYYRELAEAERLRDEYNSYDRDTVAKVIQTSNTPSFSQQGFASSYSIFKHGRRAASGETINNAQFTAAHATIPFGAIVKVINLENGREVMVRINDRCREFGDRVITLSRAAAQELGMSSRPLTKVKIEVVN